MSSSLRETFPVVFPPRSHYASSGQAASLNHCRNLLESRVNITLTRVYELLDRGHARY